MIEKEPNIRIKKIDDFINLSNISQDTKIIIESNCIENFNIFSNQLVKQGLNNDVILEVDDKNKFNNNIINFVDYKNLYVKYKDNILPFKKYLEFEKLLYMMIEPAKNLSPFEKYIYAYNIAKKYKNYKFSSNPNESHNLYNILENDYIVCFGYTNLLSDLLDKLQIPNMQLSVSVDSSYNNVGNGNIPLENKPISNVGHSRIYVSIVDPKYGINGFYIGDPAWDSYDDYDLYNYLALTDEEVTKTRNYNKLNMSGVDELFNINSVQGFYKKINFLLDKRINNNFYGFESVKDIIFCLIERLKKMDSNFIEQLKNRYSFIDDYSYKYPDNLTDLLYELGEYLLQHVNKEISGEIIIRGVEEVYKSTNIFPQEKIEEELQRTIAVNKKVYDFYFPKRTKYYADGRVEEDSTWYNKFDIDSSEKVI